MSLINDALKRANRAREQNPFHGSPLAPLQPVDYSARPKWLFRIVIGLLLLGSLVSSVWFFWQGWRSSGLRPRVAGRTDEASAASAIGSRPRAKPGARQQPIKVSTNIVIRTNVLASPQPETVAPAASTNTPASIPPTTATAAVSQTNAAAPPPSSPLADLKLQSIIFREDKPAAVVNGEMLFIGDTIRGARVLNIEPQTVTLERTGETNELRLPRL